MSWQGIEGHDEAARSLATAWERGRIAGAHLFIGPEGIGKAAFARALAKALLCERPRPGLVSCDACASCVQADAGTHPDLDVVAKPEDRATVPIEALIGDAGHRMREGLCWRLLLRPALATRRVAVILDADHLSEEAANCLLKTLEEPPAGAVIVLVGTSLERQLPTIRSRCRVTRFAPLPADVVARVLAEESRREAAQVDGAAVRDAAAAAGGSLARARLLLDPEIAAFRRRLLDLLERRPLHGVELARDTLAMVEAAGKEAPQRRGRLRIVLDTAIDVFRAALRLGSGGPPPADPLLAGAARAWCPDAEAALRHSLDIRDAVERNVHLGVAVDAWTALLEKPLLSQVLPTA